MFNRDVLIDGGISLGSVVGMICCHQTGESWKAMAITPLWTDMTAVNQYNDYTLSFDVQGHHFKPKLNPLSTCLKFWFPYFPWLYNLPLILNALHFLLKLWHCQDYFINYGFCFGYFLFPAGTVPNKSTQLFFRILTFKRFSHHSSK